MMGENSGPAVGYRHCLMVLGLTGLAICYIMRISPGITIISMINSGKNGNQSTGEFSWSPIEENAILSSFFYTYCATQLPAGLVAQRIGGKWTFAAGVTVCGLICFILPPLVRSGKFIAFLLLRLAEGLAQGFCYPSLHRIVGHWFPPEEYAFLAGVMHSGYIVGTVLALLCSGFLIEAPFNGSWPLPFYVSGTLAFLWLPFWILFVSETPSSHNWIGVAERNYIESSLRHSEHHHSDRTIPWRRIFTSSQVWLLMLCNFMDSWSNYTILVCVPQYMDSVLHLPISTNGALSAVPYIAALFLTLLLAPIDTMLIKRGWLSIPRARKLWSSISAFGKSILLLTIAYSNPEHKVLVVSLLVLNVMMSSVMLLGFNLADLDLAPPYAGFLYAVFNACSTLSGMLAPLVVGFFTNAYNPQVAWRNVLVLASAVSCLCAVLYVLFGRAGLLDWIADRQCDYTDRPDVLYTQLDQQNDSIEETEIQVNFTTC
ncbi:Vesicular glutamate transporter 3 [Fasciola hepatica]|uniref:Vesicular glutamate transporter 3 n=1 Tax=Fasciola hepatica TaxID=6192 RepID=A0A4E0RHU4_FASHE|nr:Vesicular glutamate transporter 3 [Fasciola hepatica]